MANSVDPDQTAPIWVNAILDSSVMLGNYLQQATSAEDFFLALSGLTQMFLKEPSIDQN